MLEFVRVIFEVFLDFENNSMEKKGFQYQVVNKSSDLNCPIGSGKSELIDQEWTNVESFVIKSYQNV